ncbi:MAG: potassium-transporting ATPase subunit KdpB [Candidatus Eremiobacteraeota bacterium]|nr:potassium-transporting ATPase subunit KdpB [Candidatus Eremiobacteraeota bacterium]MCW5871611.1 potassium-transporting ATPase subunit KdpB [Candidatus Eremiobacteraeota bacterium]
MIYQRALRDSFLKLDPRKMAANPVMFVVEAGSLLTTILWLRQPADRFVLQISLWLWFTVLFANFAEAIAEGRGKAQADALRKTRQDVAAHRRRPDGSYEQVPSSGLRKGDVVRVEAGQAIPADGEILEGAASVDESAITGESAPVIRESGGDRSAVTGGTTVLSDWLVIRVEADSGSGFLDRMIAMVEGANRQKTPNELALNILLAGFTILFLLVCGSLYPQALFEGGEGISIAVLVALLVCLIPTTIGGLLSAIGIAGMDRLVQRNVMAMSGRAVEAAGDCDVLLLDKTGTITHGNRQAVEFVSDGLTVAEVARLAALASLADETPEGKSILTLAWEKFQVRVEAPEDAEFVPFSAHTRMSGVNWEGQQVRKGATDSVSKYVAEFGHQVSDRLRGAVDDIARQGGTPLLLASNGQALGVIYLKDVVKVGIRERFTRLRNMGIKTIMVTGDNPVTAAAIAAEAGVDDFLAQATPEQKLELIRNYQSGGRLVAMTGDGTNDAPALAQADVAVAMNSGTQAAREAANLIDLDSNPTKLIEIVEIGKQLLITRGALSTFSIANDVAKYFAILPAAFAVSHPELAKLNFMALANPQSAILSAVIFNALIIVALIPLALKGVGYRAVGAATLLRDHLLIYGVGGLICPFIGIKLIDLCITAIGLA